MPTKILTCKKCLRSVKYVIPPGKEFPKTPEHNCKPVEVKKKKTVRK